MAETADSQMLLHRLGEAIDNNDIENVRMCINQRVDVNKTCYSERYREHMCPLALACCRGHEEVRQELLKAGADPNQVSGWSPPAMIIAAEERVLTLSMLRCLISHGAGVDFRDVDGETILHYLARGRFSGTRDELLSAAKLVLDNGVSVNERDVFDDTPLYKAWRSGNIDLVNLFITEGADVNCNITGQTMLRMAADRRDIDMFDSLLNAGANRHLNRDALSLPCYQNDHAMIARILDTCDVDKNMLLDQCEGMTILHYACQYRRITSETVRLLLDRGANVRAVSDTGNTALHYAAMKCDCNKIRQLLSYNPPLNIKNNKNQTPLVILSQNLIHSYSWSYQHPEWSHQHPRRHQHPDTHPRRHQHPDRHSRRDYVTNLYQAGLLAFKMLVIAGAKVTADDEHKLNQFHIKHPEAQIPDYEIRSTRSLKELCRFGIRGTIPVPVDVSLCKLPIPKLLQEYLSFPEFDQLVDKYLNVIPALVATTTTTTTTNTISTTAASTPTTSTSSTTTTTINTTAATDDDIDD